MIDLTPLDVRKKKGDFRRGMRGYDPAMVDEFLDVVADRLEELVRENIALRERISGLDQAVTSYRERERAMNDALVSAQQLREETRTQATREAELVLREARAEAERIVSEAQGEVSGAADAVRRIQAQRAWFLRAFRAFVERQLVEIEQEEERLRELQRREGQPPTPSPVPAREEEAGIPPWLSTLDDEPEEDS